ncbi:MAG: cell division protein SepF, partial [Lachnospiraceae bacterium]|nr:cell division protein SepF [Lachnospiraceae bacterium]
ERKNDSAGDDAPARKPVNRPGAGRSKRLGNGMEVCVIKPTSVDDSREIADTLLSNRTVVLNMEGLDGDIAQRVIDFTSGATYAINGNLQKISHYIFIITPPSVDISGDFPTLLNGSFDAP